MIKVHCGNPVNLPKLQCAKRPIDPQHLSFQKQFTNALHLAQGPGVTVARRALVNRHAARLVARLLKCAAEPPSLFPGAVSAKEHSTIHGHSVAEIHTALAILRFNIEVVYTCDHSCVPFMHSARHWIQSPTESGPVPLLALGNIGVERDAEIANSKMRAVCTSTDYYRIAFQHRGLAFGIHKLRKKNLVCGLW